MVLAAVLCNSAGLSLNLSQTEDSLSLVVDRSYKYYCSICFCLNFTILAAVLCNWAGLFWSELVTNQKDIFSWVVDHT